jgi:preprotein translocase subunit SecD
VLIVAIYTAIWFVADAGLSGLDKFKPKLGLDLEGGTSVILQPRAADKSSGSVTSEAIDQAVSILRKRVDSFGVSEAEVTRQGTGSNQTIVISIPGEENQQLLETATKTAQLRFRQVLASAAGTPTVAPTATPSGAATPSGTATPSSSPSASPSASAPAGATASSAPSATNNGRAVPRALQTATPTPTPSSGAPSPSATPSPTTTQAPSASAVVTSTDQIPAELLAQFEALDCSKPENLRGTGSTDPVGQPLVTCSDDGQAKYILGDAKLVGTDVKSAEAGLEQTAQGVTTGSWEVRLGFTGSGTSKFGNLTTAVTTLTPPLNQVAIVLDGLVVSAPSINEPITGGQAQITGGFTQQEATDLANVLKYGALPLSFDAGQVQNVSPTLGSDQLRAGLLAGAIGLALVVLYSLLYYRGLGIVTVLSLIVAGILNYGIVVLLGYQIGFRLSLAGVAGLIVAIGITADSFIVYFERLRDEVREGRTLRVAVETGWARARRTIISADVVSFLAAVVLYVLSIGSVRGFAFTLGLTTVIDVLVVFLFTKPLMTIFARTKFYGQGHRFSGLDPRRLGATKPLVAQPRRRPVAASKEA